MTCSSDRQPVPTFLTCSLPLALHCSNFSSVEGSFSRAGEGVGSGVGLGWEVWPVGSSAGGVVVLGWDWSVSSAGMGERECTVNLCTVTDHTAE